MSSQYFFFMLLKKIELYQNKYSNFKYLNILKIMCIDIVY